LSRLLCPDGFVQIGAIALTKKSVHPPIKMIVFADNQPHIKD
jgi:hypothetical protein